MAVYDSPGSRAEAVALLSPRQFHDQIAAALRAAVGAGSGDEDGREAAERRLAALLREVPGLGSPASQPPFLVPMLVDGVRHMIRRRQDEAIADPERLLGDLMEFVLAFYPEAAPPPSLWGGSAVS